MRIFKLLPLLFASALCAGISVRADDNAAQAAARAALLQKMQALDSQQGEPAPDQSQSPMPGNQPASPAPSEPITAAPPTEEPAPAAPPTEAAATGEPAPARPASTTAPVRSDSSSQAAARAALLQKMQELDTQPTEPAPAPAPVPSNRSTRPIASVPVNRAPIDSEPTPPASGNSAQQAAARAALMQKMQELNGEESVPVTPAPMETQPAIIPVAPAEEGPESAFVVQPQGRKSITPDYSGASLGFAPIRPPPAPVSQEKEAELHALLMRYKADQISPDQYQIQRAEILNAP